MTELTPAQQLLHWQRLSLTLARLFFDATHGPGPPLPLSNEELLLAGIAQGLASRDKPRGLEGYTLTEIATLA